MIASDFPYHEPSLTKDISWQLKISLKHNLFLFRYLEQCMNFIRLTRNAKRTIFHRAYLHTSEAPGFPVKTIYKSDSWHLFLHASANFFFLLNSNAISLEESRQKSSLSSTSLEEAKWF